MFCGTNFHVFLQIFNKMKVFQLRNFEFWHFLNVFIRTLMRCMWPETTESLRSIRPGSWQEFNRGSQQRSTAGFGKL